MPRRVLSEAEKQEYEKRASGKISIMDKFSRAGRLKKTVAVILSVLVIAAAASGLIYWKTKPARLKDILKANYNRVEWADGREITAEEMRMWAIKRTYPGSLGDLKGTECRFYDKADGYVGSITVLSNDSLFIYEGRVYQYREP